MLEDETPTVTHRCTQCSHLTASLFQLDHHFQRNHKQVYAAAFHAIEKLEMYPCMDCTFSSHYKLDLYEHFANHHNGANIEGTTRPGDIRNWQSREELKQPCDNCDYKAHSKLSLIKHQDSCGTIPDGTSAHLVDFTTLETRIQIGSKVSNLFHCAHCPYKCKRGPHLKEHYTTKHAAPENIEWFDCTKCSYRAKRKRDLIRHQWTHATSEEKSSLSISCGVCAYRSNRKNNVKQHMLKVHTETAASAKVASRGECSFRARRKRDLTRRHKSADFGKKSNLRMYRCYKCPYHTQKQSDFRRHMLTVHLIEDDAVEITWFDCDKCSYRSRLKTHLTVHMWKRHGCEETHDCAECGHRSEDRRSMKKHLATHETSVEIVWFNCEQCTYFCRRKANLTRHVMQMHAAPEDVIRFDCDRCEYRGKEKADLEKHLQVHSSAVPVVWFNCEYCPYVTEDKNSLAEHVLDHVVKATKAAPNF